MIILSLRTPINDVNSADDDDDDVRNSGTANGVVGFVGLDGESSINLPFETV